MNSKILKRVTKSHFVLLEENGEFLEFGPKKTAKSEIDEHFSRMKF